MSYKKLDKEVKVLDWRLFRRQKAQKKQYPLGVLLFYFYVRIFEF